MYVTTFYSYKGGVGRTMALSNVAYLLAQRGKRVLIVDFDLEAPGLSTYEPFQAAKERPGIVEYVTEYLSTNVAPLVDDFIVPCDIEHETIWLMSAGDFTCPSYNQRLHAINWRELYAERSGFLLMEDMKQQWAAFEGGLGFDYVLIDSRTGHTDVGGICTRQLPDSVVVMFVPTPQNIQGLKPIVASVRKEKAPVRKRKIRLHFCPSNVPDLDDEESILERLIDSARDALDYTENAGLVQHYQSLDLLEQPIYSATHPNSRLTKQYSELMMSIVSGNLSDRDGALTALGRMIAQYRSGGNAIERETLSAMTADASLIRNSFSRDPEIAYSLAALANAMVRPEEELAALNTVIEFGADENVARLRRAMARTALNDREGAVQDLRKIILDENVSISDALSAVDLLTVFDPNGWRTVAKAATRNPGTDSHVKSSLLERLLTSHEFADEVAELAQDAIDLGGGNNDIVKSMLNLSLISGSRFEEAMESIGVRSTVLTSSSISNVFNYAIAEWANSQEVPSDLLQRVIVLAGEIRAAGPNLLQCVALCKGALGYVEDALEDLAAAEGRTERGSSTFSCWRYLSVSGEQMAKDISEMRALIEAGQPPSPPWGQWKIRH